MSIVCKLGFPQLFDFCCRKNRKFASVQKNIGKEFVSTKKNCTFVFCKTSSIIIIKY